MAHSETAPGCGAGRESTSYRHPGGGRPTVILRCLAYSEQTVHFAYQEVVAIAGWGQRGIKYAAHRKFAEPCTFSGCVLGESFGSRYLAVHFGG